MSRWLLIATLLGLVLISFSMLRWLSSDLNPSIENPSEPSGLSPASEPGVAVNTPKSSNQAARRDTSINEPNQLVDADYRGALVAFQRLYPAKTPTREDLFSIAGEMAVAEKRFRDAAGYFASIPTEHPMYGLSARLQQGLALLELNQALAAESQLKTYLLSARMAKHVRVEDVIYAFKWLNYILSVTLRLEERKIFLEELHQLGLPDLLDSKQYLFPNLLILNSPNGRKRAEQFAEAEPNNHWAKIAVARYMTMNGEYEAALQLLQSIAPVEEANQSVVASLADAAQLDALFDSGMVDQFGAVVNKLPSFSDEEPWLVTRYRGEYALQNKEFDSAQRYFSTVLDADPSNPPAQVGFVESLKGLDLEDEQRAALERSAILAKIRSHLPAVQNDDIESIKTLISYCQEINYQQATQVFEAHIRTIEQANKVKSP